MSAPRSAFVRYAGLALAALAGSLCFGSSVAGADAEGVLTAEDARKAHAETDANGDGQIDREEFHRRIADVFYLNDTDKNGFLSEGELVVIQETMVLAPADQNHDGRLTIAEYIDQRFEVFDAADTDSNGLISVDEVVAVYTSQ